MSAIDDAVFLDARRAIRRLGPHLGEVARGVDAIEAAESEDEAHRRALDLSTRFGEVRVFGTLLSADDPVRRALEESILERVEQRALLAALRQRVEASPRVWRALARVHPVSFEPPGGAQWAAWKRWLAALPDQQVWGMPPGYTVGLRALYVPPCYRVEVRCGDALTRREGETAKEALHDPLPVLVERLTRAEAQREPLFVVGEPGVGKSALAQMLAAELATRDELQPVLVRLRDVTPEHPLMSEIARVLKEIDEHYGPEGPGVAPYLTRASHLVLVLDGFDELMQAGGGGLEGFFLRLQAMLREGRIAGAVCFGRDTLLERGDATIPEGCEVFTLLPFTPQQVEAWSSNWRSATGVAFDGTRFLHRENGPWDQLASQPLLLMLLARIALDDPEFAPDEGGLAQTYRKIITWCCERHEHERGDMRASELRRFLRVLGYAALAFGRPVVRMEDIQRALVNLGVTADLERAESMAAQTILAFSLRRAEGPRRAWEFLHRSLGEYLAAEYLAAELAKLVAREEDELGESRWRVPDAALARRWIDRFGCVALEGRSLGFLRDVGADLGAFLAARTPELDNFVVLRARLPSILTPLADERAAEETVACARRWGATPDEVAYFSARNAIVVSVARKGPGVPVSTLPRGMVTSLLEVDNDVTLRLALSFDALPVGWDDLFRRCYLVATDWQVGRWDGARIWEATLSDANFRDCSLRRTRVEFCILVRTLLDRADLTRGFVSHCRAYNSSWRATRADEATFAFCDFSSADMRAASFRASSFRHCDFTDALLEGACFAGATGLPDDIVRRLDPDGFVRA